MNPIVERFQIWNYVLNYGNRADLDDWTEEDGEIWASWEAEPFYAKDGTMLDSALVTVYDDESGDRRQFYLRWQEVHE